MTKEIKDRVLNLLNAVGHVGVDFGYGEYHLCDDEINEARELYDILRNAEDEELTGEFGEVK